MGADGEAVSSLSDLVVVEEVSPGQRIVLGVGENHHELILIALSDLQIIDENLPAHLFLLEQRLLVLAFEELLNESMCFSALKPLPLNVILHLFLEEIYYFFIARMHLLDFLNELLLLRCCCRFIFLLILLIRSFHFEVVQRERRYLGEVHPTLEEVADGFSVLGPNGEEEVGESQVGFLIVESKEMNQALMTHSEPETRILVLEVNIG